MKKLLFVTDDNMPTVSILAEMFTSPEASSLCGAKFVHFSTIAKDDILEADCVILVRPFNAGLDILAKTIKESGRELAVYLDDDLLNCQPKLHFRNHALKQCVEFSDAVISCNMNLGSKYAQLLSPKSFIQLNTAISSDSLSSQPEPHSPLKIVYAAGSSHDVFFDEIISPILPQLFEKYKGRITLSFVGVHPQLDESMAVYPISFYPGMNLNDYRAFMRSQEFDIGLAPLPANDFTKYKYFNKFIEYSVLGICGVYSDVDPFRFIVRDGTNGFLTSNDPAAWLNALSRVIDDSNARRTCLKNAQMQLSDEFTIEKITMKLLDDLNKAVPATTPVLEPKKRSIWLAKTKRTLLRPYYFSRMVVFNLSSKGLSETIEKIMARICGTNPYK